MPIEVKDVNWSQTGQYVVINVPLKGAAAKNVDIFSTNYYIKASYPPYFYELALFDEVDDESSKAMISDGEIKFNLKKKVTAKWAQLCSIEQVDKVFMKDVRTKALDYRQQKEHEKETERNTKKDREKKFTVRQQMRIDSEQKEKVKELHDVEAETISKDMEKWKNENSKLAIRTDGKENIDLNNCSDVSRRDGKYDSIPLNNDKHSMPLKSTTSSNNIHTNNIPSKIKCQEEEKEENSKKPIPLPRSTGSIQVSFTPRVLATPARESKLPEEELWLSKVAEYNKMKEIDRTDVADIEETNPMWLKDKGNEFYKKGNLVAAINAYSSALMLDSEIPMIYANRAACHLSLKQYRECIQDCSGALELYEPPVPANALSRCRALTRRGTAYFELEEYVDALRDYEEAVKLDPKNDELISDATKIRKIIQGDM